MSLLRSPRVKRRKVPAQRRGRWVFISLTVESVGAPGFSFLGRRLGRCGDHEAAPVTPQDQDAGDTLPAVPVAMATQKTIGARPYPSRGSPVRGPDRPRTDRQNIRQSSTQFWFTGEASSLQQGVKETANQPDGCTNTCNSSVPSPKSSGERAIDVDRLQDVIAQGRERWNLIALELLARWRAGGREAVAARTTSLCPA